MKKIGYKLRLVRMVLLLIPKVLHRKLKLYVLLEKIAANLDTVIEHTSIEVKSKYEMQKDNMCIKQFNIPKPLSRVNDNQMVIAYFNYISNEYCKLLNAGGACEIDIVKSDLKKA